MSEAGSPPLRWTFTLETLTPAFIGGATPRQVDRVSPLRPPSIRGVLRHWFRMGMAAVLGSRDETERKERLEELHTLEQLLFGSTERASVVVILPPRGGSPIKYGPQDLPIPPQGSGLRYLGYGVFDGKGDHFSAWRADGNTPITLTIGLRRTPPPKPAPEKAESDSKEKPIKLDRDLAPQALMASLWLWLNLGGIGARTRRGWGALRVTRVEGTPAWGGPAFDVIPPDLMSLLKNLSDGVDASMAVFRRFAQAHLQGFVVPAREARPDPRLRTLAGIDRFRVLPVTFKKASDAMEAVGSLFLDYRSTLRRNAMRLPPHRDYFEVKDALIGRNEAPREIMRTAFGLPLPFYFRSLQGAKGTLRPDKFGSDRMPSPLLFRIHRVSKEQFCVVMLNLAETKGTTPLAGVEVELKGGRTGIPGPDGAILIDFMRWASQEARLRYPEK